MSSGLNGFRAAVEGAALTAWIASGQSAETMSFDNTHFDPAGLAQWARVKIRYGNAFLATQGTFGAGAGEGANTLIGAVMIQAFAPVGDGTGVLTRAADALRDAFNRQSIGGAQFMAVSPGPAPDVDPEDEGWAMVTVTAGFELDELI